ncbi:MAG: hypothetical protein ACTHYN_10305 [Marinobacter sp.]|uniref:hypothetical protein n=1 Tax=Marinobacter sp. TaxID=50741 RepID=UPI003F999618
MTHSPVIPAMPQGKIIQGAALNGLINALVNGIIQIFILWGNAPIPISVDGITNDSQTVLGSAVPLAVSLAMILTVVTYITLKVPKRRFVPTVLWLTFKHGMFAFGVCVTGAVIWQRVMGSVPVSLTMAVLVLAVIAGLVASVVNYMTLRASLLPR